MWAAATLLLLGGFVAPVFTPVGLGLDLLVLVLVLVDARRARALPITYARPLPPILHQGEAWVGEASIAATGARAVRLRVREVLDPALGGGPVELRFTLGPGEAGVVPLHLRPTARGAVVVPPAAARVEGPWGLGAADRLLNAPVAVAVHPQARLDGEAGLRVRQLLQQRPGAHPRPRPGASAELHALRELVPGDPPARLHQRASARRGRPVAREPAWEQDQDVVILLDCGRAMAGRAGDRAKLDHALAAALALARVAVHARDAVTLVCYGAALGRVVQVDRRTRSFAPVYAALHDVPADLGESDHGAAAAWVRRAAPRRARVLALSSLIDPTAAGRLGEALGALAERFPTALVHLEDPGLAAEVRGSPDTLAGAHAKVAALGMAERLDALVRGMRARGVRTIACPADRLALGAIDAWLDARAR